MQSDSTSRPSASVLLTSIVVPSSARTMSPGLTAPPSTRFSVAPTRPITRTGAWSSASAQTASITAAPPHMSNFISCIPAAGLSEIPPESNVTALPINAISGAFSDAGPS